MTRFSATVAVRAPADRVWAELVDWPRHGDWVPLTVVRVTTPHAGGVGAAFVARTGLGPLAFDDPMTVTHWHPPAGNNPGDAPGRCDVNKHGRLIHGTAWFEVTPLPGNCSRATWHEDVTVTPHALTRYASPLLSAIGRIGFTQTLRAMARATEQRPR